MARCSYYLVSVIPSCHVMVYKESLRIMTLSHLSPKICQHDDCKLGKVRAKCYFNFFAILFQMSNWAFFRTIVWSLWGGRKGEWEGRRQWLLGGAECFILICVTCGGRGSLTLIESYEIGVLTGPSGYIGAISSAATY